MFFVNDQIFVDLFIDSSICGVSFFFFCFFNAFSFMYDFGNVDLVL